MKSNQSGYFYKTSPGTRGTRSWEWKKLFKKHFCLVFSLERKKPLTHRRSSKYDAVQESRDGLLNPVILAKYKYLISHKGLTELIRSMMGEGAFSNANHLRALGEERHGGNKDRETAYKTKLKGLDRNIKGTNRCLILRSKGKGSWTSVHGTTVSGTLLSPTEFRDF